MKKPSTSAQAIAANFQVAELEPRLENLWASEVEHGEPDCIKTNTCAEQL